MTLPDSEREAEAATVDAFEECAQSVIEALSTSLEHIPVVKIGVALVKVSASIRDQIVARKIMEFLRALDSVPAEQRREMIARLESDPEYGRHVGQHVVELLDRVDSHRKPAMIGAIFGARAKELIDLRMLYRLTDAVERLSVMEIDGVRRFKRWYDNRPNVPPGTGGSGFSIAELSHAGFTHVQSLVGGLGYSPNDVCIAFLDLNLDQVR